LQRFFPASQIRSQNADEESYRDLETAISALREVWKAANLNHTSKPHSMHQIADQSESRVAGLKSSVSRALAKAKIEAISKTG
jgi:hypothetical protein